MKSQQRSGPSCERRLSHLPRRLANAPGTAIALVALFFGLGGSAFAVGERVHGAAALEQRACAQGNVRGVAHVTGGPSGVANIPGAFTGAKALSGRRFNCSGRAVHVRRLGIGVYEMRFLGNDAPNAVANGGGGVQASAERVGVGLYRVTVYPSGRADPADFPFVVVLV
jgi:hypothetical protein